MDVQGEEGRVKPSPDGEPQPGGMARPKAKVLAIPSRAISAARSAPTGYTAIASKTVTLPGWSGEQGRLAAVPALPLVT